MSPSDRELVDATVAADGTERTVRREAEETSGVEERPRWTLDLVAAVACALVGLRAGLAPLSDNSFFTHLATGRLILADGSVPTTDPYSFMAPGESWVVQSWLASVAYASAEKAAGLFGIRLLVGATSAVLGALVWRLTRPAGLLVGRVAGASIGLLVGAAVWSERPLLFGLVFLAVTLLVAEGGLNPRWMLPVMWLWANTHGSFVFGGLVLVLLLVGRFMDREPVDVEMRALAWTVGGLVAAIVNPLGIRLLLFPLGLLERREAFSVIVEWQAPSWEPWNQKLFAAQLVLTLLVLLLRNRRWQWILPVVVFGIAAITSVRNIPQASLIMIPALAHALAGLGSMDGSRTTRVARPAVAVLAAVGILMVVAARNGPQTDEDLYPVEAVSWMRENGHLDSSSRLVSRDFVGNYLHARFGPDEVSTYMDDRVDMHPIDLIEDYTALLNDPDADFAAILAEARPTAVLWKVDSALGSWLVESPAWRIVFETADADEEWLVAVPSDREV